MRANYQGTHKHFKCELFGKQIDKQESLLTSEKLVNSSELADKVPQYSDIFSTGVDKLINYSSILKDKFELRNKLIEKEK